MASKPHLTELQRTILIALAHDGKLITYNGKPRLITGDPSPDRDLSWYTVMMLANRRLIVDVPMGTDARDAGNIFVISELGHAAIAGKPGGQRE